MATLYLMLLVLWWQLSICCKARTTAIPTKFIIEDTLQYNEVSRVVYKDFLPPTLSGRSIHRGAAATSSWSREPWQWYYHRDTAVASEYSTSVYSILSSFGSSEGFVML